MSDSRPVLTVVIPAYNAESKIERSLESVARLAAHRSDVEVLIIDDCSTDRTREVVARWVGRRPDWRLLTSSTNSGSPSRPRNMGVDAARGEFVYFHDADDEMLPDGVEALLEVALRESADLVRGWLEVEDDLGARIPANRLADAQDLTSRDDLAARIIGGQSTTCPSLVRTSILRSNDVRWREDVRMGEDTIYLAQVLSVADVVRYVDVPTFVYNRRVAGDRSSTQTYTDSALRDHLTVWSEVQRILSALGIDYLAARGTIGVREALLGLYSRRRGEISQKTFCDLQSFLLTHDALIRHEGFKARLRELYEVCRDGTYDKFLRAIKPRLLIAGYDLKFIKGALPALSDHFDVAIDEWTGHERHELARSKRLVAWADIVFCDWLLGNVVWYARHVRQDQPLIVRGHRFELERDFGFDPAMDRVDRFISVSVKTLEDFLRVFSIPRSKARLLPNWVDVDAYAQYPWEEKWNRLAIVGAVPDRKGLLRALEILARLKEVDERYTLDVFGKSAHEVDWIWRDGEQRDYFRRCDQFIEVNQLADSVTYRGWSDMRSEIGKAGWVLSVSDDESFHLAPAEGFAAGSCGLVLAWPGAEFIYPEYVVHPDVESMVAQIVKTQDEDSYYALVAPARDYVSVRYGIRRFVDGLHEDASRLLAMRSMR
ncbi:MULTISPECIES: glycosyltransferase [unclassified Isoptericola]|uniref:glycosyltransferase n=1 Tax=unclassified Isoptericola TaxID=2623355 RepID=UPI003668A15E